MISIIEEIRAKPEAITSDETFFLRFTIKPRRHADQVAELLQTMVLTACQAFKLRHPPPMRLVLQRVSEASVTVEGSITGQIGTGFLILVGIEHEDTPDDLAWLVQKVTQMRVFSDAEGRMNLSVKDIGGDLLVVSQFTLHASTKKGNRPSFIRAARAEMATPLYEQFLSFLETEMGKPVARGIFGTDMKVALINDGPVTICIDSRARE
jgi:D-aminoacyl-tRNA deacylase